MTWDFRLGDHPALLTNRVSAVAGITALLNNVTSNEPLTARPSYKAAAVAGSDPDHGDEEPACRSRPLSRRLKQPSPRVRSFAAASPAGDDAAS
jgi:hypothetical protein